MAGKINLRRAIFLCGYSLLFFPSWAMGAATTTRGMGEPKFAIDPSRRTEVEKESAASPKEKELIAEARKIPLATVQAVKEGAAITVLALNLFTAEMELSSGGKHILDQVGDLLKNYPVRKIIVRGHTDGTGSEAINQAVSRKRANRVRKYLVTDQEVPPERIVAEGLGPSRPVATNATKAGRALNRRVEIVVLIEK
jgi:OOP family OmpA-OmpF porin